LLLPFVVNKAYHNYAVVYKNLSKYYGSQIKQETQLLQSDGEALSVEILSICCTVRKIQFENACSRL